MSLRAFRIASLVVPSWGAWYFVFSRKNADELVRTVGLALGPLWGLLTLVLAFRLALLAVDRRSRDGQPSRLAQIDVLTGSGVSLAWSSALAIVLAVKVGFASLAVMGLLGTAVFHLVVVYSLLVISGPDPIRAASITRRFSPAAVTEGDEVVEEIRFTGTRIPIGFRLFAQGRIGPRWATSRHVLTTSDADGEVVVEAEVGPAVRGEHEAEPLRVWLEDKLGLCRSLVADVAPARVTVLPRARKVHTVKPLLDRGDGPRAARPTSRLPTEGQFNLREYQQGDDVRRIHWVRSLAAGELIVRLPDEIPPDRPHVRLVLDTYFPGSFALACDAPAELLDALVAVWLGVGRALVESGVRVSLVTAVARGDEVTTKRMELTRQGAAAAQRLGATIDWQGRFAVEELLTDEATYVVSRAMVSAAPACPAIRWIVVVPEITDVAWDVPSAVRMPFPMGAPENAWSDRRRAAEELVKKRRDHQRALVVMQQNVASPPQGSFAAQPLRDGSIQLERIR